MTRLIGRKVAGREFARVRVGLLNSTMLSAAALAIAATPLMLPGTARADTWLGTTGDYNTGSNWSGGVVPGGTATFINNGATNSLTISASSSINLMEFNGSAPTYQITTGTNLSLSIQNITNSSGVDQRFTANNQSAFAIYGTVTGNVVFTAGASDGSIEVFAGASAGGSRFVGDGGFLTLRGFSGGTLDLGSIEGSGFIRLVSSTTATLSVGALNTDTTYSGTIINDLALAKVGTGTLTLAGTNTYAGGTTVAGGTLALSGDGALDAAGAMALTGATSRFDLSGANGDRTIGDLSGVVGSSVVLGANDLTVGTAANTTFNGGISGTGGLVKAGSGRLSLTRASSYSGGTTISAGTVSLGNASAIGTGGVNMTASGTSLLLNNNVVAVTGLDGAAGSEVDLGDSGVLGLTATSGTYSYAGNITGGVSSQAPALVKVGAGTQTLSGDNSFMGTVTVAAGTLILASDTALSGNAFLAVAEDALVEVDGVDVTIAELMPSGGTDGEVRLSGGSLTVSMDLATNTFGGSITGSGSFIVEGTGLVQTLTGANTYTGATLINEGTLVAGANGSLSEESAVTIAAGATLEIYGDGITTVNATIGSLAGAGSVVIGEGSLLTVGFDETDTTFSGAITGAGSLEKELPGTLTLTGTSSIGGDLTVCCGTIDINGTGSFTAAGDTFVEGGALNVTAGGTLSTLGLGVGAAMLVDGPGSEVTASDSTGIGIFPGASLTISNGGVLNSEGGAQVVSAFDTATVLVTGADSVWNVDDGLLIGNDPFGVGSLTIADGGVVDSSGVTIISLDSFLYLGAGAGAGEIRTDAITNEGEIVADFTDELELDADISGDGTFNKLGIGTLILSGANTYTGLTTVSAGTLQVDGSLAGAVTTEVGGTLGGSGTIDGLVTMNDGSTLAAGNSPGALTVGSLVLSAGTSLDFELGDADVVGGGGATNDLVIVTNDLTLAGVLNISDSGTFGLGTYTLFTYGGSLTESPLTFGSAPIGYSVGNFEIDTTTVGGEVNLIVSAIASDQYWIGGDGTWNAVNTNWTNEANTLTGVWGGVTGIFRGTAGTVTVEGAQSFTALRFESDGYVLDGAGSLAIAGAQGDVRVDTGFTATIATTLTGTGQLAKGGAGTLVLTGDNTYSGGTLIAGGVLSIAEDGNLGDAAGGVTLDGGTLQLASGDVESARAFTIGTSGGAIDTNGFQLDLVDVSGAGTLTKLGTNYLDLNGTINLPGGVVLLEGGIDIHLGNGATFIGDINGAGGTEVGLLASGTDSVYAGVISGNSNLYIGTDGADPATVTLTGANTYSDYTFVDFGATLALTGSGSIAGSVELDLAGTFDISGTDNGASVGSLSYDGTVLLGDKTLTLTSAFGLFNGTIQGTGGLTLLAGIEGLAGTSTYSGATFIAPDAFMLALTPNALSAASAFTVDGGLVVLADQAIGSLAGAGLVGLADPSGLDPVELTVGGNGSSTEFSGALAGEGSFIKTGAGILTLSGDLSEFEGSLAVNGGALALNTAFAGSLTVLSGGTLQGSGTVGSVDIASGGAVAPGNSIGTLNVTGDATFSAGSTYQIEIDPTGATDLLAVGGIATLGGATLDVLKAAGSYTVGTRYTILTADGGITGTFGTLTQDMPFIDLALSYDPNDIYLDIIRNEVTFPSVGNTPNEIATGGAVESLGVGNPLYDAVVSQTSVEAARAAFNALSGEIGASAKGVLVNDSQFIRNAVFERLVTANAAAPSGMSVAPLGYAAPTKSQKADNVPYPVKAEPLAVVAPASAIWAQGFGSWGSTDGNGNAASLDRNTGGFFIGADTLVGDWRLGVLGGYSQTSFDVDARASSGESDNIHAGIYAGTNWGAINFRAGAAYTWNDISTSRYVGIPTPQLLEADYDAGTAQVFGELDYGLAWGSVDFEPFAGLAYVNLHTDSFSETGGPAALTSPTDSTDATYTTLGLRASTTFETGSFITTLRGMLGWRHAFGDVTPTSAYQFAAGGSPFTVEGLPIAEDALVMDVGLDMALTETASLGVFYSAQLGDSAQDQSVRGSLNWKF